MDEHTKLARIAVDLPHGCDEAFRVNVSKMRVSLPRPLRDPLMAIASGVTVQAGSRYREAPRGSRISSRPVSTDLAESPTLVTTLTPAERDVVALIVGLARDEFRDEPDIVRRLLSRLERFPAPTRECVSNGKTSDAPPSLM
jgi:hypothetical protein